MHPSRDIIGTKGDALKGRKIALCVTGSVAAVRAPDIARELMRLGAEVRACMSEGAESLITPDLMHWATANEVVTRLSGRVEHVELAEWADLVLVAPATANTVGKIAWAVDDTPVTSVVSVALGLRKPVVVVPAMHGSMYDHAGFQENLKRLEGAGILVMEPVLEEGKAKFPEVDSVVRFVVRALGPSDMAGMKVIITAGPTRERIDPVRFITNASSGKMGIELARAAARRGADVTLIYGPGTERPPAGVRVIRVTTAEEMKRAVEENLPGTAILIGAAAPQDFTVESPSERKLRHHECTSIRLVPAPRVIDGVKRISPQTYAAAFKAEFGATGEQLLEACRLKLAEGNFDMVVGNDLAEEGFGSPTNRVIILTKKTVERAAGTKLEIAELILDIALREIGGA
ncbi:MAG: bifunctional phosphopantothenoylcysteine decarboxylase/phosphopantothenate--cysteine ligase CoaBC [Candidatus Hadarchaeales archaeon]